MTRVMLVSVSVYFLLANALTKVELPASGTAWSNSSINPVHTPLPPSKQMGGVNDFLQC
jgi:hypothetical protein